MGASIREAMVVSARVERTQERRLDHAERVDGQQLYTVAVRTLGRQKYVEKIQSTLRDSGRTS